MKVAILPIDSKLADKEANIASAQRLLERMETDVDIAVLPEFFSTGYITDCDTIAALAETDEGPTLTTARRWATQHDCAIVGSYLARGEADRHYNRAFFIKPDGTTTYYNKYHLFSHSHEADIYSPGCSQSPIVEFRDWKIRVLICYDLRFPAWCRNDMLEYDMLIFPANWPAARRYAFEHLLIARAIENQAAVIGANRSGVDQWGEYPLDMSRIYNYFGDLRSYSSPEGIVYGELDKAEMDKFRRHFPIYADSDKVSCSRRQKSSSK